MERDSYSLHGIGIDQQSLSLYKSHIRNSTNPIMEPFLSTPNYYTFPTSKGLLKTPPLSLLHSAPNSLQPPPLLPLPASLPRRSSSCPTTSKHQKKPTKSSTSKNYNTIPKKKEKKTPPRRSSDTVTVTSTSKFGPETAALPKNLARFDKDVIKDRVDMLLGSVVFAISPPPPSSLPLPTFSLRPKLSCNAAAAGIDAGATDDLRRLLRLQ